MKFKNNEKQHTNYQQRKYDKKNTVNNTLNIKKKNYDKKKEGKKKMNELGGY